MHTSDEVLSAYIDGEAPAAERAEIESHLDACANCRERKDALFRAKEAVAGLPQVEMNADEVRDLRRALASTASRRAPLWPRIAAVAGALGVVLVAFVGYRAFRQESGVTCAPPPADTADVRAFESDTEIAAEVSADDNIKSALGACRVADVGKSQEAALEKYEVGESARLDQGSEGTEQTAEAYDAPAPAAGDAGTARSLAFCLRDRIKSIPNPTMPISARAVVYRGEQAWMLVYAYSDTADESDSLDLIQIWVVKQVDCERDEAVLTVQSQHRPRP